MPMGRKSLRLEQSPRRIPIGNAGLALLGESVGVARLGPHRVASHAELLTTYLGLLTLGKSDFEAAEGARSDPYFLAAPGLERGISAARLRQSMDAFAMGYARALDSAHQAFLERKQVPVTPLSTGHIALDLDLFPQDNSGARQEGVGYAYRDFDRYGAMCASLGEEGWCLTTELKPGGENG